MINSFDKTTVSLETRKSFQVWFPVFNNDHHTECLEPLTGATYHVSEDDYILNCISLQHWMIIDWEIDKSTLEKDYQ